MTINLNVTQAINDLYIMQRKKYLMQVKKTITITANKTITNKNGGQFKPPPLNDSLINEHLLGKASYGVFSTYQTKFIVFDFDFEDDFQLCKWYYYRVRYALLELGIAEQYIYAILSGGKGIHLTLYFDNPIPISNAKLIYSNALQVANLQEMSSQIEYRPTNKQGVKLPLGKHYKTGKKTCFVNTLNVDEVLPDETILNIHKIPIHVIDKILDIEPSLYDSMDDEQIQQVAQSELYDNMNELDIYKLGQDEQYTASYYNDLYTNGLKARNTRHKITLILAIYFKSYYEMSRDEVFNRLKEWLDRQDKTLYSSSYEVAVADTSQIVKDVFDKDYSLTIQQTDIHISVNELRVILTARSMNNKYFTSKQKLVLFALLLHSKRYTNENNKIFYMTYEQMTNVTGVTNRRSLQPIINQFEDAGLITIHRRNTKQEGTHLKRANQYEVLFSNDEKDNLYETIDSSLIYDRGLLKLLVSKYFTQSDIKELKLPRRQLEYFIS